MVQLECNNKIEALWNTYEFFRNIAFIRTSICWCGNVAH